jgi:simple sugar transport system ATP-binding protein
MRGIFKRFGATAACHGIDFDVRSGEVHALLGENGAGKTTLMRLLYGLYRMDAGQVLINGKPVAIGSPSAAIGHGIGMVNQRFLLVPTMTVLENCALGRSSLRAGVPYAETLVELEAVRDRYGLWVEPRRLVRDLPVGLQQRVEIIRALAHGASLLILDEPTAVLTPQETEELFGGLRAFAAEGNSVVLITHKLKEVMAVSNRVTVLRQGRVVGEVPTAGTSVDALANMMTGRWQPSPLQHTASSQGPVVLSVRDLSVLGDEGQLSVRSLSFDVRSGEILGVAGVDGNGQGELAQALRGLRSPVSGRIEVDGKDVTETSVHARIKQGLGHIPDDRDRWGLFLGMAVHENLISQSLDDRRFSNLGVLRREAVISFVRDLVERFEIVPADCELPAGSLSGGNQQKVVVAREVSLEPSVLIASQPTRGLDVMAADFVRRTIIAERDRGAAVLLISADLAEVMAVSDRVGVMYEGQFVDIVDPNLATMESVGLLMAGVRPVVRPQAAEGSPESQVETTDLL